ncbi:hypothetical protein SLA2020_151220 [Shorea laevis]
MRRRKENPAAERGLRESSRLVLVPSRRYSGDDFADFCCSPLGMSLISGSIGRISSGSASGPTRNGVPRDHWSHKSVPL